MIHVKVDFSHASQAEMAVFYSYPELEAAIEFLKIHKDELDMTLTIRDPNDALSEIKEKVLEWMRKDRMVVGNYFPNITFEQYGNRALNPKEISLLESAYKLMEKENILVKEKDRYRLTQVGFNVLY